MATISVDDICGHELAERLSVPEMVAVYQRAESNIRASFATIHGAIGQINGAVMLGGYGVHLHTRHDRSDRIRWDEPEEVLTELRRDIWRQMIERMQLRKAMSVAAWEDLTRRIKEEDPPQITEETVDGMLKHFHGEIPTMLKAAVDEVFDFLRPPRSDYKTNTEFEIGERVCLSGYVERAGWGGWHVNYHYEQHLIALENVFAMVDGKIRSLDDGYHAKLTAAIRACGEAPKCHGETELFEFRGFKNRALHLRFKRLDLVEKLNRIAGGARLKPPEATR